MVSMKNQQFAANAARVAVNVALPLALMISEAADLQKEVVQRSRLATAPGGDMAKLARGQAVFGRGK
jgi:hypothetical protein